MMICITWFYKLIFLSLIILLWRKEIPRYVHFRYADKVIITILALAILWSMPRYRTNSNDRIQLVYQTKDGKVTRPPLYQYIANTILPEEEVMNWGLMIAGLTPDWIPLPISRSLGHQYREEYAKRGNSGFIEPIKDLRSTGSNPMSGVCSQMFNMMTSETRATYIIRPKQYDEKRAFPLVVFCHGYLGNWRFYNGILKDLDNCMVLCIGTKDISGIFSHDDIAKVFSRHIPFLEDIGYHIDKGNIHLIGLSNGGTASDLAYRNFSHKLKSITFISCHPDQTYRIPSKIILIGGGKDHASDTAPLLARRMRANGNEVALYWHENDNHFTFAYNHNEIIYFLNKELQL